MIWLVAAIIFIVFLTRTAAGGTLHRGRDYPRVGPFKRILPHPGERPRSPDNRSLPEPTERPVTLQTLQDDFAEGRITVEEYEHRLDEHYGGRGDDT